jgi:hypothetical protein
VGRGQELQQSSRSFVRRDVSRSIHFHVVQGVAQGQDFYRLPAQRVGVNRGCAVFDTRPGTCSGGNADRMGRVDEGRSLCALQHVQCSTATGTYEKRPVGNILRRPAIAHHSDDKSSVSQPWTPPPLMFSGSRPAASTGSAKNRRIAIAYRPGTLSRTHCQCTTHGKCILSSLDVIRKLECYRLGGQFVRGLRVNRYRFALG